MLLATLVLVDDLRHYFIARLYSLLGTTLAHDYGAVETFLKNPHVLVVFKKQSVSQGPQEFLEHALVLVVEFLNVGSKLRLLFGGFSQVVEDELIQSVDCEESR